MLSSPLAAFRAASRVRGRLANVATLVGLLAVTASAQVHTFAGNAQHTSQFPNVAQRLNRIKWTYNINPSNIGSFAHYASPLVTANNTVIATVRTASNGFQIVALDGATGTVKYTLSSDFVQPSFSWVPVCQPVIVESAGVTRLYYQGAGGSIYHVDNADTATPTAPVRRLFYTSEANYLANKSAYDTTVFANTPITADSTGNIFFGFRVQGTAPAPLSTTQSGWARMTPAGTGSYTLASSAVSDANVGRDTHNLAPALSADETTVYVVVKHVTNSLRAYLVGLDADTLATKYQVMLRDPRNGNEASVPDDSTASPMVAPDGDVYFGVMANPGNGSRGWLLRFSADLTVTKTPGGFGWDYTPGVVPSSMIPSYTGPSPYLIFAKYNNYSFADGNGVNRIAILDPNSTQIDPHTSAGGLIQMREVLTVIGPTRDNTIPSNPIAVREWCINAAAVDVPRNSMIVPCEDGFIYRWNLETNTLSEGVQLNNGLGQPYVPTIIGPDGTVYVLNGGNLFAVGAPTDVEMDITSNRLDMRAGVFGESVTFTATVSDPGAGPAPTGTVTFSAVTYNGTTPENTVLAANVPLDASGQASFTTSALQAGGTYHGTHKVTATYSGDGTYGTAQATMVQKVHAYATATSVTTTSPSNFGDPVTVTATVSAISGVPTGHVTFTRGSLVLGQRVVDSSGVCSISVSGLSGGAHSITATYASDIYYAASSGSAVHVVNDGTSTALASSANPSAFGNAVTFTATVTPSNPGTVTGSVTFRDGLTVLGTSAVNASGQASLSVSNLTTGTHSITASFVGTNGWANSTSSAVSQVITGASSTAVASSLNPSSYGDSVTFTATVSSVSAGAGTPVGTVTFKVGATTVATAAVDVNGQASYTTSSLAVGTSSITADFAGSNGWGNSQGSVNQVVQAGTSTGVSTSPNPSNFGASVTITATVSASAAGAGTPTGSVTFKSATTVLGSATVNGLGVASMSTTSLAIGAHTITAEFTGSGGWQNSSDSTSHTVDGDTTPPSTPTGLTTVSGPNLKQVTISWTASSDASGISHYEVYYSNKLNGQYKLRGTSTTTSFIDTLPKSKAVAYYYVVAVDNYGNKSAPSAKVQGVAK